MFREVAASKVAKLLAACICPVAGTAAVTAAVPQVREAVHRATAPRQLAAPKTRVRPAPQMASASTPCIDVTPLALPTEVASLGPVAFAGSARSFAPGGLAGGGAGVIDEGNTGPTVENPGTPPAVVPEPAAWVQMIVGFGLVGGATRLALQDRSSARV